MSPDGNEPASGDEINPASDDWAAIAARVVMQRCDRLGRCSDDPRRIDRQFASPAMMAAHRWVRSWMEEAGMVVALDDAANLVGHPRSPSDDGSTPTVWLGSHLDTVPGGGRYDGALGVVMGIALADRIRRRGEGDSPPIGVVGLSEEEGVRFSRPYLGSAALAGRFDPAWLLDRDAGGVDMNTALQSFGCRPTNIDEAKFDPPGVSVFMEPHIEQGPVLRSLERPVGVVTAIAGQTRMLLRFGGSPAHAGTTPMTLRSDALVAASRFVVAVAEYAATIPDLRATVGRIEATPNVRNVVPGSAVVSLDVRHARNGVREDAVGHLLRVASRLTRPTGLSVETVDRQDQPAARMDAAWIDRLRSAGGDCPSLVSGAGHDCVVLSESLPTAMIFIRQRDGGVSHHPDESVHVDDVAEGLRVMERAVLRR